MIEPLIKTIEVPCGQQTAFRVFIEEMESWWPLDKFTWSAMNGAPAKGIRVETRAGGAIVEVGADGSEVVWGAIVDYEPHDRVSMDFHIPAPQGPDVPGRSRVEVTFTPVGDRTRVKLTQTNWEAFGEHAEMLRGGYTGGWEMIFVGAYAEACAKRAG